MMSSLPVAATALSSSILGRRLLQLVNMMERPAFAAGGGGSGSILLDRLVLLHSQDDSSEQSANGRLQQEGQHQPWSDSCSLEYSPADIATHLQWNHVRQLSHKTPTWLDLTGFLQIEQGNFGAILNGAHQVAWVGRSEQE